MVDKDYFSSLSGLIDALKATTLSLPVTDGAKVCNEKTLRKYNIIKSHGQITYYLQYCPRSNR